MDFEGFDKIPRLFRDCVITEKLDGTNAQVTIVEIEPGILNPYSDFPNCVARVGNVLLYAGSRNRYVTVDNDNYGFARWVVGNADNLAQLGVGRHFGEWWGNGIQRGYGLTEKRFSLFNVGRWNEENKPACCHVVPVIDRGLVMPLDTKYIRSVLGLLQENGSLAAPGFMNPEGIIVYHTAANSMFKATIENDEQPKGKSR